jgi:membrane protein implicated in regulation of membrane protease activity
MELTHYAWWIAAVVLTTLEIMTGTFYVLMVAIGAAAGGVAALYDTSLSLQVTVAIIVGFVAVSFWHRHRIRSSGGKQHPDPQRNPDMSLDIGAVIDVDHWSEGRARVSYRGSQWDAQPEFPAAPVVGRLVVKAVRGSILILGAPTHTPK